MSALDELKVRARVRLNAARREGGEGRLRDQLHQAAREVGFRDWEHARRVLGGEALPGDDMGTFWYSPRPSMLNAWFADLERARVALAASPRSWLLPYRRQFLVAGEPFLRELGLDPRDVAWEAAGHDLAAAYGTPAWYTLAAQRVRAPRSSFEGG